MKPKSIGTYESGYERIELFIRGGFGGELRFLNNDGKLLPCIYIGMDEEAWMINNIVFHEIFEFIAERIRCRFKHAFDMANSTGDYWFIMNHNQFEEINARAVDFFLSCQKDLMNAWKQYQKDKR